MRAYNNEHSYKDSEGTWAKLLYMYVTPTLSPLSLDNGPTILS